MTKKTKSNLVKIIEALVRRLGIGGGYSILMFIVMYCTLWAVVVLMGGAIELMIWLRDGTWTSLDYFIRATGWRELVDVITRLSLIISIGAGIFAMIRGR